MRVLLICLLLTGCAREPLSARIADKDPAYICKYFAQYVFDGASNEALTFRNAMRQRGLDKDPDCRMVYESRMTALSARPARRVPWEVAVGQ